MTAKESDRTGRAVKGTLVSFLQYGTQMLLQAFLAPLVLRLAGQETLGAYALLMQVVGYLAMLDLGFSVTLNRYLAQATGCGDGGERFRAVLSTARTFLVGSNLVIVLLTLLVSLKVDTFFSLSPHAASQARMGLALLAFWEMVRAPWLVYGIGLNATQNLAAANLIGILGNVGRLLFSLGFVLAGSGLVGLMLANVLAELLSAALSSVHFLRLYPAERLGWGLPDRKLFREMLTFSLQALLINVAWRLVYYTDHIVVGYLFGASAVSIYYVTQMPATIGFNIANRVSDNAAPAVNELFARGEEEKLREVFLKLHRLNFLIVLPLVAGLLLLNRELVSLWVGPGQYAGQWMTAALAIFALLITISHVNGTFIFASGKIRAFSVIAIAEGVANLALSLWLGRTIGLSGVMIATVIANLPTTGCLHLVSMRRLKIGAGEYFTSSLAPSLIPLAAGALSAAAVQSFMGGSGWSSFVVVGCVLMSVFVSLTYRLGLTPSEREWVSGRLSRVLVPVSGVRP